MIFSGSPEILHIKAESQCSECEVLIPQVNAKHMHFARLHSEPLAKSGDNHSPVVGAWNIYSEFMFYTFPLM